MYFNESFTGAKPKTVPSCDGQGDITGNRTPNKDMVCLRTT